MVVEGLCIPATHPCLTGHFPGNPIVPAVVLLDEVLVVIRQQCPQFRLQGLPAAKFLSPLRPGESYAVRLEPVGQDFRFECYTPERVLARGSLRGAEAVERQA